MHDDARELSPRQTLAAHGLRPRRRFGQNFLVDPRIARRVAEHIPENAFVIEIGAGTGTLTAALGARARSVVALEIDRDLVGVLRERFDEASRIDVREGDALQADFGGLLRAQPPPRAIAGNLPYYITSPLIERIVEASDAWEVAVIMVQREYAQRLTARPATPEYGSLTVFVAYHCDATRLFDVGAAGFYPAPAVASSAVMLTPRPRRGAGVLDEPLLLRTIRAAFAQRRKTLSNCLRSRTETGTDRAAIDEAIRAAGLDPSIRGERLSLGEFRALANALADHRVAVL